MNEKDPTKVLEGLDSKFTAASGKIAKIKKQSRGSIISKAKGNIFEFPVFVANSVTLDYATATTSLLEQVYTSYLQMAISVNPVIDKKSVLTGTEFSHLKTNTNKYLEHTDMTYAHDACHSVYTEGVTTIEYDMMPIDDAPAKAILEYCDYVPLGEFDHYFQEAKTDDEDEKDDTSDETKKANLEKIKLDNKIKQHQVDRQDKDDAKADAERTRATVLANTARSNFNIDNKVKASQMIDESKINKLNTMKPLMMIVNLRIDDGKGITDPVEYIVGVKTHSRLIQSDILPEMAEYPIKEMSKITRKVKWRAGELKFFKDIVFRIKQKKQTAVDSKDPNRKWYRRLYELAHTKGDSGAASMFGAGISGGGVIPNASILITKGDVDNIKAKTGIDLLNGETAVSFCKDLFLIALVVLDVDAESIKILLPDLHNDYEVHSLAAVNKQLSMLDTSGTKTRDMFKLLG